jgi:2-dehydro-3-deoxygluconokinase
MKYDLTTFGETMVRLSVRAGESLAKVSTIDFHTGGTESNTAVALARLGMNTAWVSRLTDNALGRRIESDISGFGVDTSGVIWTAEDRVGAYYVEYATAPRSSSILYDRKNSAVSKLNPKEIDWAFLLNTRILHLTGITPALSNSCNKTVEEALANARAKKIPVSFDVNYRAKLWKPEAAAKTLAPLVHNSALLIMTQDDAATVFKMSEAPEKVVRDIKSEFNTGVAVLTMGNSGAISWDGKSLRHEPGLPLLEIVDRLGAGDAFAAGLIYGFLKKDIALGMKYGITMSAMKMGMRGDYFWATHSEVEHIMKNRRGDVRR